MYIIKIKILFVLPGLCHQIPITSLHISTLHDENPQQNLSASRRQRDRTVRNAHGRQIPFPACRSNYKSDLVLKELGRVRNEEELPFVEWLKCPNGTHPECFVLNSEVLKANLEELVPRVEVNILGGTPIVRIGGIVKTANQVFGFV